MENNETNVNENNITENNEINVNENNIMENEQIDLVKPKKRKK